jgi:predicted membrane-bound dolichyl-phosphate-mannose-protein mannosyltransferase
MVGYLEGILKIANLFLSVIAGIIAISLFKYSREDNNLKSWYILIVVLILFAVQEILGALRAFQIYSTPHLTHVNPSIMLGLLIWALALQVKSK